MLTILVIVNTESFNIVLQLKIQISHLKSFDFVFFGVPDVPEGGAPVLYEGEVVLFKDLVCDRMKTCKNNEELNA